MASVASPANDGLSRSDRADPDLKDIDKRLSNELVIALVGPVGSGCTAVYETMASELADNYEYDPVYVRFTDASAGKITNVSMTNTRGSLQRGSLQQLAPPSSSRLTLLLMPWTAASPT